MADFIAWWIDQDVGPYDHPEMRPLGERCLLGFGSTSGPPSLPVMYNNLKRIVQTEDYVMILIEMNHDARIVRMNAKHEPRHIRKWLGDSVGHWDGDTLVVDTTNFRELSGYSMASEELQKALAAYEKAGANATDGKIDLRRGYLLTDLEDYDRGTKAVAMAIRKGGLADKDIGQAYLLKGMCEFGLGNYKNAREDFGNTTRYDRTRSAAQQWIAHMNEERARRSGP